MADDKKNDDRAPGAAPAIVQGRLGRLARMTALGVRTGASLLLSRDGRGAAEQAAAVLGDLRGLATKFGQMASYVDGLVPEGHRDAYEGALRTLRAAAPRSDPAAIRRLVEEELRAPIAQLFARWDDVPMASASIGQVHRAALFDGREVAVKVQHPGIGKAVESDLGNAGMVESMLANMGGRRYNSGAVLAEFQTRIRAELDYAQEAEWQRKFAALHENDPHIRIPAVIDDRSSGRVLTTLLCHGLTFEEACARPEPQRAAWCRTLWRFVFRGNLLGKMFNADPHPGNYFFDPDHEGRVTFLDFGCVLPLGGMRHQEGTEMHRAALVRDEARFRRAAVRMLETRGGRYEELATGFARRCFDPLFHSPYRMTRTYSASLFNDMKSMALETRKLKDFVPMPAEILFLNRLQFGFYSVLARLDAEVDYAEVERGYVPQ